MKTKSVGVPLTTRLYSDGNEKHVIHLPKVEPRLRRARTKDSVKAARKEKPSMTKETKQPGCFAHVDDISLSDSDSDGSCSSYFSSGSEIAGAYRSSEKTQTDQMQTPPLRRYLHNVTHTSSQETTPDSPSLFASASLPIVTPVVASEESLSVKSMRQRVASNLSRHNHHILLHNGQSALNSHIQITVNSKAANEIAAHAVITEVPALLPNHRQRAHQVTARTCPGPAPPTVSANGAAVMHPGSNAAPRRYSTSTIDHNMSTLMSPLLSPRGTVLLSPLHDCRSPPTQQKKASKPLASTPCSCAPPLPHASPSHSSSLRVSSRLGARSTES